MGKVQLHSIQIPKIVIYKDSHIATCLLNVASPSKHYQYIFMFLKSCYFVGNVQKVSFERKHIPTYTSFGQKKKRFSVHPEIALQVNMCNNSHYIWLKAFFFKKCTIVAHTFYNIKFTYFAMQWLQS